jgi:hypothetical protein
MKIVKHFIYIAFIKQVISGLITQFGLEITYRVFVKVSHDLFRLIFYESIHFLVLLPGCHDPITHL